MFNIPMIDALCHSPRDQLEALVARTYLDIALVQLSLQLSIRALKIGNDPLQIIQCAVGRRAHLRTFRAVLPIPIIR